MKIYQVDAFSETPFKGNPAGVCVLDHLTADSWMQNMAMEMNLSETAFVIQQAEGFGLRWFTPKTEVSLCGHATLAAAHILWEQAILPPDEEARFHTQSGLLVARRVHDWIEMDFPARRVSQVEPQPGINRALGVSPRFTGRRESPKGNSYLIEIEAEETVVNLRPDLAALAHTDARTAIVTCRSVHPDYDFVSRFFAPAIGINEDPVTGSAHCYLAPYWAERLGKPDLIGFQASKRSGLVGCRLEGDIVHLRGKAVTVIKGEALDPSSAVE
jgi:predicted PhzF superfamily epimerase YddE/YHI9